MDLSAAVVPRGVLVEGVTVSCPRCEERPGKCGCTEAQMTEFYRDLAQEQESEIDNLREIVEGHQATLESIHATLRTLDVRVKNLEMIIKSLMGVK